jgi:peptidoglycan-N-acetylmuramic acid deacetylase
LGTARCSVRHGGKDSHKDMAAGAATAIRRLQKRILARGVMVMKRWSIWLVLGAAMAFLVLLYSARHHEAANAAGSPYHFGFKRSVNGSLPSIGQEGFRSLLERYEAIFLGDTSRKELYLTFDNGYENGYTAQILDVLAKKRVPAAFFVTGHYVKSRPDLVKRMAAEGHIVGNHSWSHPDMTTISDDQIVRELDKVKQAVAELTGQKEMRYLRPPRGIFDERVLAVSRKAGYTSVFWSIAYADWDTKQIRGAQYAYDKVISQLHPGAVILLHAVSKDNAEALERIIDEARRLGYEFKSLDDLRKRSY